ncbi:class I SAM-dependent methyltransferase [Thiohalobacter sp. IOR34]|uniref:class I SAM-dependent methyltransferase n=1 Tax=Thiohalobacter sp. IOR34 TaxID=3057176 RepID=UPI0025AFC9AF|nr:class I SAM-dependent methyltransferase [Thiohalobacter sp. IOR34]WJW76304.1 class I SAM-dependent methyltransferase [Thiohalobacter sp. IOR34]
MASDTDFLEQEDETTRQRFRRYFVPLLEQWGVTGSDRILCLGCGGAADVFELQSNGFRQTYGIDMGWRAVWWGEHGLDPRYLCLSDGRTLPFEDETFDVVISLGVIEHVGAVGETAELYPDYEASRIRFLREATRVLKKDGNLVIACPNRGFPIDFQHNISRVKFLQDVASKTGLSFHSPWNPFLPSYADIRNYLCHLDGDYSVRPLAVANYLGLAFRNSPLLKPVSGLFRLYLQLIDRLPSFLMMTGLNPYLLANITRKPHNQAVK